MKLRLRLPGGNHNTKFICIDTHLCEACWTCIESCPNQVLGKVDFKFHRHANIADAGLCDGCLTCVDACPHGAILPITEKCQER